MKVEQTTDYLGSVECALRLLELANLLDLVHQITTIDVLHYKVQPVLSVD